MKRVFGMVSTRASYSYTPPSLRSFFECTPLDQSDLFYLIDNDASIDAAELRRTFPRAELIVNPRPLSFAENANQIITRAGAHDADAYFMNNDIIFTPDWAEPLKRDIAVVMTPTCNQNYQYRTAGLELKPVMTLEEYVGHEAEFLALVEEHRRHYGGYTTAYKTNFFCVKIPPRVYRTVGLFDTGFGQAGGEDDDYCLRAHLQGFGVMAALGSYLLHFGGRSTWGGPENRQQWHAREQHFIGVFQRKWGPSLSRFLLHRDPSIVQRDPRLQMIERIGGIGGLVEEIARRDGVPLPCPRWRPRFAAVCLVRGLSVELSNSIQSVYENCERVYLVTDTDAAAGEVEVLMHALPDGGAKIQFVKATGDEAALWNAGLDAARGDGIDRCLIVEPGEVYDPSRLQLMFLFAAGRGFQPVWHVHAAGQSGESSQPVAIVACDGSVRFTEGRATNRNDGEAIPAEVGYCQRTTSAKL